MFYTSHDQKCEFRSPLLRDARPAPWPPCPPPSRKEGFSEGSGGFDHSIRSTRSTGCPSSWHVGRDRALRGRAAVGMLGSGGMAGAGTSTEPARRQSPRPTPGQRLANVWPTSGQRLSGAVRELVARPRGYIFGSASMSPCSCFFMIARARPSVPLVVMARSRKW